MMDQRQSFSLMIVSSLSRARMTLSRILLKRTTVCLPSHLFLAALEMTAEVTLTVDSDPCFARPVPRLLSS